MTIQQLIGRRITNISQILDFETGGLDRGDCFIELDNEIIIVIPYGFQDEVAFGNNEKAASIFEDLSDYPVYHVNKEGKSIKEISDKYLAQKKTFWQSLMSLISGRKPGKIENIPEYEYYKIEYRENRLKYIKDGIIKEILVFKDEDEKVFIQLENGYIITETNFGQSGTGRVGINLYDSLSDLIKWKGDVVRRITA